jgi:GMP synthase-like glutamine amidotransferase
MTNFLFLQNSTEKYSPSRVDLRFHGAGFKIDYYWAYQNDFPAKFDDYRGVFISGSPHGAYETIPWIDREHEVIQQIAKLDIPTLGVCFGSQILASALCGRDQVFRRNTCEVGYLKVDLVHSSQTDPLLRNLSSRVDMFIWHNDEVRHQHPDIRVIGSTDDCPNQIWRYRDKPIWGIQGHPELTRQQARQTFEKNRKRLQEDGADVDRLIRDADETVEAKKLIDNFIKICVETR